jgi:effector-binding domain-containing protein
MNLTEIPEIVQWEETHYVFIEKVGPFMKTAPMSWQELHSTISAISENNQITKYFAQYKIGPQIYRAGVALAAPPVQLPEGLRYVELRGGKYSCFVLTGSFAQLPDASRRAWEIAGELNIPLREEFAIENYVNDPRTTREEDLRTEILLPTA